jgi:opacity protein-like surface antigen
MTRQFRGARVGVRLGKRAKLGGVALLFALGGISGAQAQCVTTPGGGAFNFGPLSAGGSSAVTALVSTTNAVNTAFLTQTSAFIGSASATAPDQQVGGVWTRLVAGEAEVKSTGTSTATGTLTAGAGSVTATQNSSCNNKTEIPYAGYQAGLDLARLNLGNTGTNIYFGTTIGYLGATGKDVTTGVGPHDFGGQFQVPFVGVYGALVHGGFFADAQVLANFYQMQLTSPSNGVFDQGLNAHGWSATGNVGYHHDLANNWFVEPSVGVTWSRTIVDPFTVAGTLITGTGIAPPATLQVSDIDSVLGRVGVRVGTSFTMGNLYLQPFATAAIWHEFAGDVTATAAGTFSAPPIFTFATNANFAVSRIGTFGQVGAGIAGTMLDTGFLGYARVDVREGENITAVAFNAGLRYQFNPPAVVTPGIFKAKAPVAPIIEAYNWTGFYVGGFAATGWGHTDWTFVPSNNTTSPKMAGFLGGGEVGFNYQFGWAVVGVEGDFAGLGGNHGEVGGLRGAASCPNAVFFTCNDALRAIASLTGRLGFTWDRALFYGKAGAAWTRNDFTGTCNTGTLPSFFPCVAPVVAANDTRSGWTAGAGVEYGLTRTWSAKAEYDHYDFGTKSVGFSDGEVANIKETVDVVKIGINYRWVPDVVVAKY